MKEYFRVLHILSVIHVLVLVYPVLVEFWSSLLLSSLRCLSTDVRQEGVNTLTFI